MLKFIKFFKGILLRKENTSITYSAENEGAIYNENNQKIKAQIQGADREVVTADQTQILSGKDINADNNDISNLEVDNLKAGVLDTDLTTTSASDDTIPSAKAVKTYVDNSVQSKDEASEISYDNTTSGLLATNVQGAIDEVDGDLQVHIDSGTAHDAADIVNAPTNGITSITAQGAINELQTNVLTRALDSDLTAHENATQEVHGLQAGSSVVGTTDTQELTNKQITGASIENPTRLDPKKDTFANLLNYAGLPGTQSGEIVYATDVDKQYYVANGTLKEAGGGGAGAGISPAEGYEVLFYDDLSSGPTTPDNKIDNTRTTGTFSSINEMYELKCDKSVTFSNTGAIITLNTAPSFTVVANDVVVINGELRRIDNVASQTVFNLDAPLSADISNAPGMVSQALYTQDMVNFGDAGQQTRIRDIYPSEALSSANIIYFDSLAAADGVEDFNQSANVAVSLANEGVQSDTGFPLSSAFGSVFARETIDSVQPNYNLPTVGGERLFGIFFCNPNNSSVTAQANLTEYRVSFVDTESQLFGDTGNSAIGRTNQTAGQGMTLSTFGGKTRIHLDFTYPAGVFTGKSDGALDVILDGQVLPRYINNQTVDAYYKEITNQIIELDSDYSSLDLSIEVRYRNVVEDVSSDNAYRMGQIEEKIDGIREWAQNSFEDSKQTSEIEAPFTTIQNRAKIKSGLDTVMGIESINFNSIKLLQGEAGPNGETVYETDSKDSRIRFVGDWGLSSGGYGSVTFSGNSTNDYLEVIFYGTGLNLNGVIWNSNLDFRITVDDGVEGSSITTANYSNILGNRNYRTNSQLNIVSGLPIGWHNVKIRNANSNLTYNLQTYGVEIINESAQIQVAPGAAFAGSYKQELGSLSAVDYKPATMGTSGGRVVKYLLDGSIGESFTENTTALYLSNTDHSNEELIRSINFKEFGASRADDFSTLTATQSDRFFTLDDGTTTLKGYRVAATSDVVYCFPGTVGAFLEITFVGTGLDLYGMTSPSASTVTMTLKIDGQTIATGLSKDDFLPLDTEKSVNICSGLPYGTHTVLLQQENSGATGYIAFSDINIYQPKKPSIPNTAVEIADYNVMANYNFNDGAGLYYISNGILRKDTSREFIFANGTGGTNWSLFADYRNVGSTEVVSDHTSNSYVEYTFFGTGFDFVSNNISNRGIAEFSLNGTTLTSANFPTAVFNNSTNSNALDTSTGRVDFYQSVASGNSGKISVSNLPLGLYTLRLSATGTKNASATDFYFGPMAIDVHTPIHINDPSLKVGNLALKSIGYEAKPKSGETVNKLGEAKAWLVYDQTTNAIKASKNISQILDVGVGSNLIFFDKPFKDRHYAMVAAGRKVSGTNQVNVVYLDEGTIAIKKPNSIYIETRNQSTTLVDVEYSIAFFGELADED